MVDRAWVIDDDQSIRWVLERALSKAGILVQCFDNAGDAMQELRQTEPLDWPDAIVSDIRMPGQDGLTFLNRMNQQYESIPVIIMTAYSDLDSAVSSFESGAFEYLPKPFDVNEAIDFVKRACSHSKDRRSATKNQPAPKAPSAADVIGEAPAMQEVFRAIGRLAKSHVTVLINGESGTGKELIAGALHKHSPRSQGPFIALNMAAIPSDLMESELFGHEKGAFTGAQTLRRGRFEQAHEGTLFLDEIGDMPASLQTRLLRVLAEGQFYRVGGHSPVDVDVRIIAATHQNLEQMVLDKQFREDLFHRLNVIRIKLPALRERREDIPVLLQHFLHSCAEELQVDAKHLTPAAEQQLQRFDWPGNVRQLENVARWITVMASGREVCIDELPEEIVQGGAGSTIEVQGSWALHLSDWADCALAGGEGDLYPRAIHTFEKTLINSALKHTGNRKVEAAQRLGIGRNTLTRKLKELSLEVVDKH